MTARAIADPAYRTVVSLTGALFLSYLAVAMAMPAVPILVVNGMGLDGVCAGLAVGVAFLTTILTRARAGASADRIGGKVSMERGVLVYAVAGLAGLMATARGLPVPVAYPALIASRLLLGLGESLALVACSLGPSACPGRRARARCCRLSASGFTGPSRSADRSASGYCKSAVPPR